MVTVKLIGNISTTAALSYTNDNGPNPSYAAVRMPIARDNDGRFWEAHFNDVNLLVKYSDDDGDTWNLDITLHPDPAFYHFQMALDNAGNPALIITNDSDIFYTKRTAPGVWNPITSIGTAYNDLSNRNKFVSFCLDPNDKVHIVTVDSGSGSSPTGRYLTNVSGAFTDTVIWNDAILESTDSLSMVIAADSLGFLHLFYRYRNITTTQFLYYYAKKTYTGSFPELNASLGAAGELIQAAASIQEVSKGGQIGIAINNAGVPAVCWSEDITGAHFFNIGAGEIWWATRASGAWISEKIFDDPTLSVLNPSIAVSVDNTVHMLWHRTNDVLSGDGVIVYAAKPDGGLWTLSDLVSAPGKQYMCPRLFHMQVPHYDVSPGIAGAGAFGVFLDFKSASNVDYYLLITPDYIPDEPDEPPPPPPPEPDTSQPYGFIYKRRRLPSGIISMMPERLV